MQCDCPCVFLHIIGHYVQKKEDVIHSTFKTWIPRHKTSITHISADILNMKKRCVDDYLCDILQPGFKWDEIGVLILCRMFHLHVSILKKNILNFGSWQWLATCKIYIAVTDKLTFSDTRGVDDVPPPPPNHPHPITKSEQ